MLILAKLSKLVRSKYMCFNSHLGDDILRKWRIVTMVRWTASQSSCECVRVFWVRRRDSTRPPSRRSPGSTRSWRSAGTTGIKRRQQCLNRLRFVSHAVPPPNNGLPLPLIYLSTLILYNYAHILQDKDTELGSLNAKLLSSSPDKAELESRLRELTESLIQKQTTLETLNSERHSLNLQMQRMQVNTVFILQIY